MIFMAIQIPNPGTGNGATGDNEFALWSKVKSNFEDATHAASKLVGSGNGQVPMAQQSHKATFGSIDGHKLGTTDDCNDFEIGTVYLTSGISTKNSPPTQFGNGIVRTLAAHASNAAIIQIAMSYTDPTIYIRSRVSSWTAWQSASTSKLTYDTTTAAGANTVVDITGRLMRSTSSERYKDILADLELDDAAYANAMQLAPIVYRSTADADNPDYHYYSFSAEKLGAFDPAFTLWRETETIIDDKGNVTEQPLAERVAEGININALLAFSHAIAIKQDKMIKAQSEAIETLTKRINAMTAQ